ncbi:TELO2-interacting protein 1 [Geosmithia morbida]|uniref:TELO2-interacting protein 1 n=1 Tax=Geosmithia morbida TaxID=1094350 RepID=A0A9P4YWR6_9HYPO|nr:TELO2-interacting protein 1 [Geosmithia morbida]KAF4123189.1 TELO2-interacting protein 1 [Geosmithia morbida]
MDPATRLPDRNDVFQKLKPCCVRVSQLAIRESDSPAAHRELLDLTRQLRTILSDQVGRNPDALDEKIAEYAFFPLSHIFRQMDAFPMLLVEDCMRCLRILIVYGWRTKMAPKMAEQLLSLLGIIIDRAPVSGVKRQVPEETTLEGFRTLTALFKTAGSSMVAATGLEGADALPALGHGIMVMLDGVADGSSDAIRLEALDSIRAVYTAMVGRAALANFLPGTMSTMTRVLSTPKHYKRALLARCLETVGVVLTRVLGDVQTRQLPAKFQSSGEEENVEEKNRLLSPAWLKATAGQVRLALSSMMKLRTHEGIQVQNSLRSLCVKLLDECHTTLADCAPFLVETAMILDRGDGGPSLSETSLRDLMSIYPELTEKAKSAVYSWLSSLPRVMQANDGDVKRQALHNLSRGLGFLHELKIESATLEDTVSGALRDSTIALMADSKSQPRVSSTDVISMSGDGPMQLATGEARYPPVLLDHQSQRDVRAEMVDLLGVIGSRSGAAALAMNMLGRARTPGSTDQVASMWLCFELVKAIQSSSADETDLLDMSAFTTSVDEDVEPVLQDLYSFSVEILDSHAEAEAIDWRIKALALEITSYSATRSGESFRPELVDVLFPVVTFLGSPHHDLRQHAIVALDEIASACGYSDVSTLVIDNVDYMVNSVALRLDSLDISPASTQVLTMMIRLTGPRLVPFLDDVVESVFGALENYHGYPMFVESLFSVLKELVDQAVKSDVLLLEGQEKTMVDHTKTRPKLEGVDGLLALIHRRRARETYRDEEDKTHEAAHGHPTAPWGGDAERKQQDEDDGAPAPEPEKPPNTVTYQLLLRISRLTQHYLTSPTPRLRRSLLDLVSTASPALAADEEAFLPLVNDIWPVVVSRLYDQETYVAVEACGALSEMCLAAGDFLASRFKTEWSDGLRDWCRRVKRQVLAAGSQQPSRRADGPTSPASTSTPNHPLLGGTGKGSVLIPTAAGGVVDVAGSSLSLPPSSAPDSGSLGQHSSPVRLWEALVRFLTTLVTHVRLSEQMFEDILDILVEVAERSNEVRTALEIVNPDAVWLALYERGHNGMGEMTTPKMDDVVFVSI